MDTQETPLVVYRDHWTPEYITLVCGIANAGGGTLVIESNDNIYTTGHRKMRRPFEQIPRIIERDLGIQCTTEPVLDGINLYLEILVPAVAEPLTYEGEYWLYSEGHNTRSTRETVWASLNGTASQQDTEAGDTLSWEMRPQPYVEQGQLNARQFLALGLLKIDAPDPPTSSVATAILRRIDYLNLRDARGEGITNAAIVLLHNHPETIIPGATVQLELVAQDNHALLRNEVGGGISCQVEESLRLLFEQYLPMAVATSTTTENPVIALNFPPQEAVHDVLLDAIVGKNYETGQPVRVSVHPDKLIISMPCGGIETPGGANPVLARALHLMGYLDSQNANFERAVLRCGDMGAPLPVIEHGSRETTVTFSLDSQKTWQMSTHPPTAQNLARKPLPGNFSSTPESGIVGLGEAAPKDAPFSARSIAATNNLDFTSTDEYVLRVLHTNGRATAVRIAGVLGVSESTIRRSFRKLREYGLIERVGSDKAGYWRVNS